MPIISALRQEEYKFKPYLGYIVRDTVSEKIKGWNYSSEGEHTLSMRKALDSLPSTTKTKQISEGK
jgi:hypothetical protein